MNLDKCIRILLMTLSQSYKIKLVEFTLAENGRLSKSFNVTCKEINTNNKAVVKTEKFRSKRDLVSWLMCLK